MAHACPLKTQFGTSLEEACGTASGEVKAYKLGRSRWSYNEIELVLVESGGSSRYLTVQAVQSSTELEVSRRSDPTRILPFDCSWLYSDGFDAILQGGGIEYSVKLVNGVRIRVQAYLCLDSCQQNPDDGQLDIHGVPHNFSW